MKHVILEAYSFNNSTRTVTVIGKNIRREQLLLITNVTSNTVIYNFSDPALGATSFTNAADAVTGQETTTVILAYNTTAMAVTDKLAILVEETYTEIVPAETMRDPVDKLRVSTPQSLIDTDFEYGPQPTKWESLNLLNNRPSAFYDSTQGLSNVSTVPTFQGTNTSPYQITNVAASGKVVTVTINNTTGITVGLPIFVQGTLDNANADGWWLVESVTANTNFTYTVVNTPAATLWDANKVFVFIGTFFTGAATQAGTSAITLNGTVATVATAGAHGLRVGDGIYIVGATGMTGTLNSSWTVATTPTSNSFTFACTATGTITTLNNASIFSRSLGYVQHRPFDGGVQFSNVSPYHGYQVIRQTRRQFRYQSGKGIQFSTGSIIKPALSINTITSSGATATVNCKFAHGLLPGSFVRVQGSTEAAYNGIYLVQTVPTALTFTYTTTARTDATGATPTVSPAAGFPLIVSPWSWYGSSNRVGMFDAQNGFFFEFDGQTLYVVKRSSTQQITGVVDVTNNSATIIGTGTQFSLQLKPGDSIVIRGQSYFVQTIQSDTVMYVSPAYRGITATACQVSKTVDTRFPQSSWNIDRCDGTGASLYNLDLTRMQMFYADYTWYGAGSIRFGFKNARGEVVYCHRIPNNNTNTEAYMRSGNLVARYETNTLPARTFLTSTLTSGITASMSVNDTSLFPSAGTLVITQAADAGGVIEYITYTGKTTTSFTGLTRNVVSLTGQGFTAGGGTASATTFTYSATAPINVESYSPGQASTISHWGSSVIMDGRYDDDKSLVFNAGNNAALSNLAQNIRQPILSIRISPTVDNGLTGLLGVREIINRMQLTLRQMDVYVTGTAFRVELFLNGRLSGGTFASVGGSSLAQVAYHTAGQTLSGGESIFGFFTSNSGALSLDLSNVRDIGNSILGGGNTLSVPSTNLNMYPDGPDIITVCCTNITTIATNTINSRLSWTEAQA